MATNSSYATKVHEEIQQYIKSKKVDHIVSTLMEQIIKYRPNYVATFIVEHIIRKHADDVRLIWTTKLMQDLTNRTHMGVSPNDYSVRNYVVTVNTDIQADLEEYISNQQIHQLFSELVEKLLLSEASNPYSATVEYLCEKYPEQGILALELNQPQKNTAKANMARTASMIMREDNSDADSDEDGDTFKNTPSPRTAPQAGNASIQSMRRRFSVSSESLDPAKLKEQVGQIAVVPKEPEVAQTLFQIVTRSPMLRRMLDAEERALIVKAFAGPVVKHSGETIITQGEVGDVFYLIEKGNVDVFLRKGAEGEDEKVHTYTNGDTFGQLALMYNAPRAATCRATGGDVKMWTLDRVSFKRAPILQSLTELEVMTLADSMTEEKFDSGVVICREGEPGDEFYIVSEGTAECYQRAEGGERLVAILTPGQYFGEIALLTTKPRQATVRAKGPVKLLIVDRATFVRVLGPLQEVLKRNMENYKKFTAV